MQKSSLNFQNSTIELKNNITYHIPSHYKINYTNKNSNNEEEIIFLKSTDNVSFNEQDTYNKTNTSTTESKPTGGSSILVKKK